MAVANNNLSVLPFYKGKEYWHSNQWYTYGQVCPVMMKHDATIPFQFVVSGSLTVSAASIRRVEDDVPVRDLTVSAVQGDGYTVIVSSTHSTTSLPFGQYYYSVTLSDDSVYMSDIVGVIDDESKYVRMEYWNSENMYYEGGHVEFENGFHFILYVQSTIGKPEYEFQEEITERLGYKFIDSQISNKVYNFVFPANEALCDAVRLIRMCDYINIKTTLDTYNAIYFSNEVKWEDNGDIAAVTVSFETDTIIQKLESINRTQVANFYNALLAAIDEPIMFDEGVVAQYYQEFQSTGTVSGKLIRQLNEATEDEVKENDLYLAVDFGSGEAKKVRLSIITKLFGSSFLEEDEEGNVRVKDGKNFYTEGEISAGGYSEEEDGGAGGIFGIKVNGETYTPEDGYITLPDYSTGASILGIKVNGETYTPVDKYITIPDYPTELAWGAITGKPTTLAGYGIQASDILAMLKTVDGSGSGLGADTLDGYHYSDIINGNVASATKLKTSRTIWGQSFDGTNNVDGDIYINGDFRLNGNYAFFKNDGAENGIYFATKTNGSLGIYKHTSYSYKGAIGCFDYQTGYWGVNTESPSYNLHVNGTMYAGGATTFGGKMSVSGLITAGGGVVTQQYIQIGNGRIYWDENNKALYVKSSDGSSAINFYSLGEISAGGYSEGGGSGTGNIFGIKVNGQTYTPVDGYITIPNYPTSLTWGSIANKPTTIAGYGITDAYTKTQSDSLYVNAGGDTMTGPLKINSASLDQLLVINSTQTPYMEFQLNGVRQAVFGGADGVASVYTNTWHEIWHAGNDGSGSGLDADTLDSYHYSDIINGNVASATKLQTKRTIWGQKFDGTADVNGDFKLIGDYMFFENASSTTGIYFASKKDGSFGFYGHNNFSYSKVFGVIDYNTRFWGIGTETPSYMMHINGTMYAAGASVFGSSLNVLGLVSSDTGFSTTKYIQIGDGRIYWDSTNNALYVKHKDGTSAINFYSLGEISAGGYSDAGGGGSTSNILGIIVNGGTYTPSNGYITLPNYPTSLAWGSITGKPTTLSGYGITDGVNNITTSGSGSVVSNITLSGHTLTVTKTNISSGGVTSVSTSGSGNAVTSASISGNTLNLTKGSSFLLTTGNAASALKLYTSRTLWGRSFDGTNNITGTMEMTGFSTNWADTWFDGSYRHPWYGYDKTHGSDIGVYSTTISDYYGICLRTDLGYLVMSSAGNVGVGTTSPSYKLHVNGSMYATSYANSSDIRLKNKRYDINISTNQIASAPTFVFSWINDGRIDIGTSAQYWKDVLPDVVREDNEGYLTMPNANIALASVICLARNVETIEQRVARLERENSELKQKIATLANVN